MTKKHAKFSSRQRVKELESVRKSGHILWWTVRQEMGSQDTQCLYALVEVEPNTNLVQTAKKVTKVNLRITVKPHVHLGSAVAQW